MTSRHRLFVAVWPPDEVIEELTLLHRKDQRGVRFVPPERWHVTLRFLGDADPDEVADALDTASLPAARASLGPGVDVLSDRVLVVPVGGLDQLAHAVVDATRHLGDAPGRRFIGHLTLARLHPRAVMSGAVMPRAMGALVLGEFDVDEVALVQSRLDPAGSRYTTLARWPVGTTPTGPTH